MQPVDGRAAVNEVLPVMYIIKHYNCSACKILKIVHTSISED